MSFIHAFRRATTRTLPNRLVTPIPSSLRQYAKAVIPSQKSVLIRAPTKEELDDVGVEDPVNENEACVVISDRAAAHLQKIANREKNDGVALRVAVESGGCHGYQYKVELTDGKEADDYVFGHPTTQPSNVVVDAMSLRLVNGATIDFATELIGSSFRITDNPQASGSGCGCGVSWEAKT